MDYLTHLLTNTLPQILEALLDIRGIVIRLIRVLAGGREQLLVRLLERINARLELDVVVRQLRLFARAARLLLDPLLTTAHEWRD